MDIQIIIELALGVSALVAYGVGIVKYVIDKSEKGNQQQRAEMKQMEDEMRKEIALIKENHVKREDHNRHAESVERQIRDVSAMVSQMAATINTRLDGLFAILTRGKNE